MLARVDALATQGRGRFDADEATRHQLRYLWIVVGSTLKNYCEMLGIERGASAFSPVIGFRHVLAYPAAGQIDDDLVWRFSTTRGSRLARHHHPGAAFADVDQGARCTTQASPRG